MFDGFDAARSAQHIRSDVGRPDECVDGTKLDRKPAHAAPSAIRVPSIDVFSGRFALWSKVDFATDHKVDI